MKSKIKRILLFLSIAAFLFAAIVCIIDYSVEKTGAKYLSTKEQVSESDAIIVFGAYVFPDGKLSDMLHDRLDTGYELYNLKKAPKIIVSGDHGKVTYDEVNTMRKYLESKGVPREDIFMDHAGFDTYSTLYRARDIFKVKKAILVTQRYHLVRALYIGKKLAIDVSGISSDLHTYPGMGYYRFRDIGARNKAFLQAQILKSKPKYLGKEIPIWNSGVLTDDGK